MIYYNATEFEMMHNETCPENTNVWNVVSDQYDPETLECPHCGARYTPAQTWFNSEANPQYDENGRKVGSGEYQELEFEGEIPE